MRWELQRSAAAAAAAASDADNAGSRDSGNVDDDDQRKSFPHELEHTPSKVESARPRAAVAGSAHWLGEQCVEGTSRSSDACTVSSETGMCQCSVILSSAPADGRGDKSEGGRGERSIFPYEVAISP